ncbi:MAG: calcium-binding protein [Acetobacteraceae bacterium]|nr:calcium-binding protein [Acetobacteraceae bacterium]
MSGTTGPDTFSGTDSPDSYSGGDGNDNISGNGGNDTLNGDNGIDTILGGAGDDVIDGGAGDDQIRGEAGEDVLYGGAGNDFIWGDSLPDQVFKDVIYGGTGNDILNGYYGNDSLFGEDDDDTVNGSFGDDTVDGGAGNDSLRGEEGNDVLFGRAGVDTMRGGPGNDNYSVTEAADLVIEDPSAGLDTVRTSLAAYALTDNVEWLVGTTGNGQALTGNALANTITGGAGADTLNGGDGNDSLQGNGGADNMSGGLGNDVYLIDGDDVVFENAGEGIDRIRTSLSSYTLLPNFEVLEGTDTAGQTLIGNAAANTIIGWTGNDVIQGLAGNDSLDGGAGADTMSGSTGNDVYVVGNSGDVVIENANEGTDTIRVSLLNYSLISQPNVEHMVGVSTMGQNLTGNNANNSITGGSGADTLNGGVGDDTLDGGTGVDSMLGGVGDDVYYVGYVIPGTSTDAVIEYAGEGRDTVYSNISGYVLPDQVEDLFGNATAGIDLAGNSLNNRVRGTDFGEEIRGGLAALENDGNDTLEGLGGNDNIFGGEGIDSIEGGDGNDSIYGGTSTDIIKGGLGWDYLDGDDINSLYTERDNFYLQSTDFLPGNTSSNTIGDTIVNYDQNSILAYFDTVTNQPVEQRDYIYIPQQYKDSGVLKFVRDLSGSGGPGMDGWLKWDGNDDGIFDEINDRTLVYLQDTTLSQPNSDALNVSVIQGY